MPERKIVSRIRRDLRIHAKKSKAEVLQKFFKTGPGEYGEGDVFIGVTVPVIRSIVRRSKDAELKDALQLLASEIHEERLTALLIMVSLFDRARSEREQREIFKAYLGHVRWINNWDLVDSSAEHIVGGFLAGRDRKILRSMAHSRNLWKRRIAMLATSHFIKRQDFKDAFIIARLLLGDREDLIHKAVGWMLREVHNHRGPLEQFLARHYQTMPRTMLRYAIEKFPEKRRQAYLKGAA